MVNNESLFCIKLCNIRIATGTSCKEYQQHYTNDKKLGPNSTNTINYSAFPSEYNWFKIH